MTFVVQPNVAALSAADIKAISGHYPFYGDTAAGAGCSSDSDASSVALSGDDNYQKGFNFFVEKLSSKSSKSAQLQSAAIIGNLKQESGMNPKSHQNGGGPGRGLAQWTVDGRWLNLLKYVETYNQDKPANEKIDEYELGTQLNFIWMELNGTPPAGDYSPTLKLLLEQTDIVQATTFFEEGYERAGEPNMPNRIKFAQEILAKYGDGTEGGGDSGEVVAAVSGSSASCASVGAVICDGPGSTTGLSQVRQNVVCVAQGELAKWESGKMKPGTDFYTYSQGRDEEWCADFTSWVYNKANYPISESAPDGNIASVQGQRDIGEAGERFEYHAASGYTPVPGDIVVYQVGWSHVNIVVSVNANKKSMNVIGGNQSGSSTANTSSKVTEYPISDYASNPAAHHITGYISPKGDSPSVAI